MPPTTGCQRPAGAAGSLRTRGSRTECRAEGDGAAGDHRGGAQCARGERDRLQPFAARRTSPRGWSRCAPAARRRSRASRIRARCCPLRRAAPAGDETMGGRLGLFVNGTLGEGDKDETEFEAAVRFRADRNHRRGRLPVYRHPGRWRRGWLCRERDRIRRRGRGVARCRRLSPGRCSAPGTATGRTST